MSYGRSSSQTRITQLITESIFFVKDLVCETFQALVSQSHWPSSSTASGVRRLPQSTNAKHITQRNASYIPPEWQQLQYLCHKLTKYHKPSPLLLPSTWYLKRHLITEITSPKLHSFFFKGKNTMVTNGNEVTFIRCLLDARYYVKHFKCIILTESS